MRAAKQDVYCVYDSQLLTSFTSSLYIAGLVASLGAGKVTRVMGRRASMLLGGSAFMVGSVINCAAMNVAMLILGRILLGFGVGFTNQATPVYLSEMAPPKWRGAFNSGFQIFLSFGVVAANLINYGTTRINPWGWRLSLGIAAVPALIITVAAFFLPDTPSSLIQRGHTELAKETLRQARGSDAELDAEFEEFVQASKAAIPVTSPYKMILKRRYRPQFVMSAAIPFLAQMTGINVIAFYAPILFETVGFGKDSALMASVILGAVSLSSNLVSTYVVDRHGRRILFLVGGTMMMICQVIVACLLAAKIGSSGDKPLRKADSVAVLVVMCMYSAAFGWSWGPLAWLVPSEILPLEIRPAGLSISTAIAFVAVFLLAQTFLAMLCHFKYGIFLFYAGWLGFMTGFIALFLPETKGIPLDSMNSVWKQHWYWGRFLDDDDSNL
ncbi:hypothetical protein AMTR_s00038p00159960 [Amborella trichopoda]|uniref:Major facilitator superfamily (MFS) profile domain-containing protein n=2 Tax=Amborella trichopoda TaxID=13333 RepID=U5D2N5_AMBTC|nr:hypothetical protein AMTR_s00038p00159960 [Amborella trichopoda]